MSPARSPRSKRSWPAPSEPRSTARWAISSPRTSTRFNRAKAGSSFQTSTRTTSPWRSPWIPALSPAANAQSYYAKYQKARKTLAKAREHLEASLAEQQYLESVHAALEMSESLEELREIEGELSRAGYLRDEEKGEGRKKPKPASPPSSPLRLTSSDGFAILVGRNNRQNDYLTMEVARSDDLWLHAKEIPGAHVIVQTQGKEVPDTTLVEAAHVAAFFSRARESANVPVDYTRRRHVRKPRGARPGMVIYDHQRTLYVTPDRELLARLGVLRPQEQRPQ